MILWQRVWLAITVLTGLWPIGTMGQQAGERPEQLQEIVVTARKIGEESLQRVPLSIKALTSEELERAGADGFAEINGLVPSLQTVTTGPTHSDLIIRGVTTGLSRVDRPQIRETVGLYMNDAPLSVAGIEPDFSLVDLDRIEVLRGPQGTLYGAGAMAGALRLITKEPNPSVYEGMLQAALNTVADGGPGYSASGVANVPLVQDLIAVRAVGMTRHSDGYLDNVPLAMKDTNAERTTAGRVTVSFQPSKRLSAVAFAMIQESHLDDAFSVNRAAGQPLTLTRDELLLEPETDRSGVFNATINYDGDGWTVVAVTTYLTKYNFLAPEIGGLDTLASTILTPPGKVPPVFVGNNPNWSNSHEASEEIRISSNQESPLRWVAGAYAARQRRRLDAVADVPGFDAAVGFDERFFGVRPDRLFEEALRFNTRQYAAFGEANYQFSNGLTPTLGLRVFKADQDGDLYEAGFFEGGPPNQERLTTSETGVNPKVNIAYTINQDALVYVQAAKGFRLGGPNEFVPADLCAADLQRLGLTAPPKAYKSDSLWDYEIGTKTSWLNQRIVIDGAAFLINWSDIQTAQSLACGFSVDQNAGKLRSKGVELDASAVIVPGLTLTAGGAYTDARLLQDSPNLLAIEGDRAPFVPLFAWSGTLDYRRTLTKGLDALMNFHYARVGERFNQFNRDPAQGGIELPPYDSAALRLGIAGHTWQATLFMNNVWDKRGVIVEGAYPFSFYGSNRVTLLRPRTSGIELRATF